MVTVSPAEAFLFFGAALIGLSIGVFGNLWATGLYRICDDLIERYSFNKETVDIVLFIVFTIIIGGIMWYLFSSFTTIQSLS
jgi:hypothetical protein